MPPLLTVEDLRTHFDVGTKVAAAVDGVDLSLQPGRTLCLVGESGSGKSVTALSILGLLERNARSSGRILFDQKNLLELSDRQMRSIRGGRIAMIFQEPATSLNPVMTIGQQIVEAIRLHRRVSRRQASREAVRLLAETMIPEPDRRARQYPHELSGGMKQRAMIAMALAGEPELLLADEPTTALDVTVQAEILRLLRRIQLERQLAILLITHDLGVVAEIADDVTVMYAGQIVESATANEFFVRPRHPYSIGLLGSVPKIDDAAPPIAIDGVVPLPTAWPSGCRFRNRCPKAFDACKQDPQVLTRPPAPGKVACWLEKNPERRD